MHCEPHESVDVLQQISTRHGRTLDGLVDVKDTFHVDQHVFVDEEHDGVERERSHHGDGETAPERSVAALVVDGLGTTAPVFVDGVVEAVGLHAALDGVDRHDVPRRHARYSAREQHHTLTQTQFLRCSPSKIQHGAITKTTMAAQYSGDSSSEAHQNNTSRHPNPKQ